MQLVCRHTQTGELFITCGQKLLVNQLQHRGTESRRSQLELERWRFRDGGGGFGVAKNAPKLIAMFIGDPAPGGAPVLVAYLQRMLPS